MRILDYIVSIIIISTLGMLYKKYQRKYGLDEELNGNNLVNKYLLNDEMLFIGTGGGLSYIDLSIGSDSLVSIDISLAGSESTGGKKFNQTKAKVTQLRAVTVIAARITLRFS